MNNKFLSNYFSDLSSLLDNAKNDFSTLIEIKKVFQQCSKKNKKIIFCGNGGSAATASHAAVDFSKNAKIRSINFNESDLITCLSNDYGYENWISAAIKIYADKGDILVLMSCSGKSQNLLEALKIAKKKNLKIICLTGIDIKNPLKKSNNKGINIWVNSKSYNQIEIMHHMYLLCLVDLCMGKSVYLPS